MKEVSYQEFYSSDFYTKESNIEVVIANDSFPYTNEYRVKGTKLVRGRVVDSYETEGKLYPVITKYYIA